MLIILIFNIKKVFDYNNIIYNRVTKYGTYVYQFIFKIEFYST